jgi:hypothetical protein
MWGAWEELLKIVWAVVGAEGLDMLDALPEEEDIAGDSDREDQL